MKTRTSQHHHLRTPFQCADDGMTKQSHKKECDINTIMAKYQKSGVLTHVNKHSPQYDFATSKDLHASLNIINEAQSMFDDLPSQTRKEFKNDPGAFLDYVQDPKNQDRLYGLGLTINPTEANILSDIQKEQESLKIEAPAEK